MDPPSASYRRSWTPIGETSYQLVVYHPPSHAIQVVPHPHRSTSSVTSPHQLRTPSPDTTTSIQDDLDTTPTCPMCGRNWSPPETPLAAPPHAIEDDQAVGEAHYFRVLERAHELSRPGTPLASEFNDQQSRSSGPFHSSDPDVIDSADLPAMGYYQRFFVEEGRLGIGAEGSVYLATHVISGNTLGTYAVKKIAVGTSKSYLVRMLREVRLLESLRHPNIIPYYHSWVDETRFSSFGPPILALHVLMMYATAGNLDAFLLSRSHTSSGLAQSAGDVGVTEDIDHLPKLERIKAFKRRRQSGLNSKAEYRGVLLLGRDEIFKLFGDVVEGLAFLHANSVLHLDLKCSNVLLHWEEGQVVPKALLSDFGTSEEMLRGARERTGHTGTMEYMAPETIVMNSHGRWRPSDSHADMWSLGMVLYKMLFLQLPYKFSDDLTALHSEILEYPGFCPTSEIIQACERRHLPADLVVLLGRLLNLDPEERPSADKVNMMLRRLGGREPPGSPLNERFTKRMKQRAARSNLSTSVNRSSKVRAILPPVLPEVAQPHPSSRHLLETLTEWSKLFLSLCFVTKVMSVQILVLGRPVSPVVTLLLTVLALLDLLIVSAWFIHGSLALVHVGILIAVLSK